MSRTISSLLAALFLLPASPWATLSRAAERETAFSTQKAQQQPSARQPSVALLKKVRRVLDEYYLQPLNTRDDPPWSVLHWSIAYGVDARLCVGHPKGKQVTAIGWLCSNYPTHGKQLFTCTDNGFALPIAPGLQGHDAQFLWMLALARVPESYLVTVCDQELTVADLVEHEKQTCEEGNEQTFKLVGIAHYEGTQSRWKNQLGEPWSVERLLLEELDQPISARQATCGGLHRLYALHYAAELRRRETTTLTGPWQQAAKKTRAYQKRAFELQNADGSFSTAWLDKPEQRADLERRLITSGHVLEWLAFSLTDDDLHAPRFQRAVSYVTELLDANQHVRLHRGGMGHALHALVLYEQRMLGTEAGERSERLVSAETRSSRAAID